MKREEPSLALLTVVGKDRPGIIAEVTAYLFQRGANLEDVSMTVLEGELAMSLMVRLPVRQSLAVQKELKNWEKKRGLSFFWKNLPRAVSGRGVARMPCDQFIISVFGLDKMGIVYHISRLLAGFNLNITDLNSKILTYGKRPVYALVLEVDIPRRFSLAKLERGFAMLRRKLNLDIAMKRVEQIEI